MHVCHTILVRGNHYQRKTMKDECSNVLIAVILGYLEFFIIFFSFSNGSEFIYAPQKGTQPAPYLPRPQDLGELCVLYGAFWLATGLPIRISTAFCPQFFL